MLHSLERLLARAMQRGVDGVVVHALEGLGSASIADLKIVQAIYGDGIVAAAQTCAGASSRG